MSYSQSFSNSSSVAPLCLVAGQHLWPDQTSEACSPKKQLKMWQQRQSSWKASTLEQGIRWHMKATFLQTSARDALWNSSWITDASLKGCWEVSSPTFCSKQCQQWGYVVVWKIPQPVWVPILNCPLVKKFLHTYSHLLSCFKLCLMAVILLPCSTEKLASIFLTILSQELESCC